MDRLDLYYGDELNVLDKIIVKHPKLIDIKNLGFEKYQNYINSLTLSPKDVADILWFEMKTWYEEIPNWSFFLQRFQDDENVKEAIQWFTSEQFGVAYSNEDKNSYCLWNEEKNITINEYDFMLISDFLREINFMSSKSDLDIAGNKRTKIYLLKQMSKRRKKARKENIDLASIVSSLDWKSCKGNEIWSLPIYRIYEGYFRLNQIVNYENTMFGLYSGSIDTSKNPINYESINWSNIINI